MLEQILDNIEGRKSKVLARQIEWLDRYFAITEMKEKKRVVDVEMMACKQYSELGAERGIYYRRQRNGLVDRLITDEEINKAIKEPPKDTRANLRVEISNNFNIESIDWSIIVVNDGTRRSLSLSDPYANTMEDLDGPAS